jgi:cyanate permease
MVVFGLSLHAMGYYHGYTEVGGNNSGLLSGIGNQIANLAGLFVPYLSVALKDWTGSWFWSFGQVAVISIVSFVVYVPLIKVEPPTATGAKKVD